MVFGILSGAVVLFVLLTSTFPPPPAGQQMSNSLNAPVNLQSNRAIDADASLGRPREAVKLEKPSNAVPSRDANANQIPRSHHESVDANPDKTGLEEAHVPPGATRVATVEDAKSALSSPLELPPQPRGAPAPGKTTLVRYLSFVQGVDFHLES